jgi:3-deoxy-D-manno-octulosonate 8-phosphate phosphatase (KDO 8-P phosphatase)
MAREREELLARAAKVRLFIFDVDGVLTDGSLSYGAQGELMKTFNVHDGLGIKLLQESGVKTAIISARITAITNARAKDLGIDYVHQGGHDKLSPFKALLNELGLTEEQVAFIGDDVVDLPLLRRVGLAVSVPNGRKEAQQHAHYITEAAGGRGAVREACEFVLHAQDNYQRVMAQFLA